jgi:hypothetical protein
MTYFAAEFEAFFLFSDWGNHRTPWSHCQHHVGFTTETTFFDFNRGSSIFFDKNQNAVSGFG